MKIKESQKQDNWIKDLLHNGDSITRADEVVRSLDKTIGTMQLGVAITTIEGKILYINASDAGMHGYTVDELIGKDVRIFAPAELRNPVLIDDIRKFPKRLRESINVRKDGTLFPVQLMHDLLTDSAGNPVFIVTTCEDITARKHSEQEIRRVAEHQKQLLEITKSLLSTFETRKLILEILQSLRKVIHYDFCTYYQIGEEFLRPIVTVGNTSAGNDASVDIPLISGIINAVTLSGKGKIVNNARSALGECVLEECEHLVTIPVLDGEMMTGIFVVCRTSDRHFTTQEFELVEVFIDHASIVMKNAQLFEQLKTSEEKYRLLFEASKDVVYIAAPDGSLLDINPVGVELSGYGSKEELLKINVSHFWWNPKDRENLMNVLRAQGFVKDYEMVMKTKEGRKHYMTVSATVVRDAKGSVVAHQGILHDITERKKNEEELRKSKALLLEAQQVAQIGSWEWDVVVNKITWSDELYRIFGLEKKDFQENYDDFLKYVHPADRDLVDQNVRKSLATHKPLAFDYRIVRPDSNTRWVSARGRLMVDQNGQPVRMIGIGQDITERKEAEQLLVDSQKRLQALFDNTQEAILLVDEEGRFIDVNAAADKLFGYSHQELLHLRLRDVTEWGEAASKEESWNEPNCITQSVFYHKNKGRIQVEQRSVRNIVPGVHLLVLRDVSDRLKLEKEVLEISERERQRIGQDLHDELGQQLTGIAFLAKALEEKLVAKKMLTESETSKEIARLLNEAIGKTKQLIHGIYPFKLGTQGLIWALHELSEEVESRFKIRCSFEYTKPVLPIAQGKAVQLYRIAQEAINNAIKHAKATNISIWLRTNKKGAAFTIQDDGVGLPEICSNNEGMGLSIMKHRARLMDATFQAKRLGSGGSKITVSFRLVRG